MRTYYQNKRDTLEAGLTLSKANPKLYVTAEMMPFTGAYVTTYKRLNVYAPSDSLWGVYWLNGKQKNFSDKQVIADQNATPMMY